MLRHISILTLRDDVAPEEVLAAAAACRALLGEVEGLVAASAGPAVPLGDGALADEAGISQDNGDLAIVLDFADVNSWKLYAGSGTRRWLVREVLRPLVSERRAIQYEL